MADDQYMYMYLCGSPMTLTPSRVVVFVDQFRELLERALNKWDSLTEAQWTETVHHIIPEVSTGSPIYSNYLTFCGP